MYLEHSLPVATMSMIGGAMRAKVELDTEPTNEMNRSNLIKTRTREQCAKYCRIFMINSLGLNSDKKLGT